MSWSFKLIGTPSNVAKAIEVAGELWDETSKKEYEQSKPHLSALVKANFSQEGVQEPLIEIEASGHGYFKDGVQQNGSLTATIKPLYGTVV